MESIRPFFFFRGSLPSRATPDPPQTSSLCQGHKFLRGVLIGFLHTDRFSNLEQSWDRCTNRFISKMLWLFQQRKRKKKKREVSDVWNVWRKVIFMFFGGRISYKKLYFARQLRIGLGEWTKGSLPESFKIILHKILELPFQDHRLEGAKMVPISVNSPFFRL